MKTKKSFSLAIVRQKYSDFGGAERFADRLVNTFLSQGAKITILARQWSTRKGLRCVKCDPFYIGRLWRQISFERSIQKYIKHNRFDIIQSHERVEGCQIYRAGDGVHAVLLEQLKRVRPFWRNIFLNFSIFHNFVKHKEKRLFEHSLLQAVICNSSMVRDEIIERFEINPKKIHLIYNGVDTKSFCIISQKKKKDLRMDLGIPVGARVYLILGSNYEIKNVETVIEAFKGLKENTYLLIVGKGKQQRNLEKKVEKYKINDRVLFLGKQRDVQKFYGLSDVFVLPSLYDPGPNVVLEAMATGLPVITSSQCGAKDFVYQGNCGFVHDALDTKSIQESMAYFYDMKNISSMSKKAREIAEQYNLEKVTQQLEKLYNELIS